MEDLTKMILFISYDDQMVSCVLPGINDRKISLDLSSETGIDGLVLDLEIWDGNWYIFSSRSIRISKDHQIIREELLTDGSVFGGKVLSTGQHFQLRAADFGDNQTNFIKYDITGMHQIDIGQDPSCHIVYSDKHVSRYHAVVFFNNGDWYIEDRSRNGTWINGRKINKTKKLTFGDHIMILDYQIIFLGQMLAVNGMEMVRSRLRYAERKYQVQKATYPQKSFFSRSPRFMEPLDQEEIEIEAPPALTKNKKMPIYLTIGPSMTMPIPILMMVLFNVAISQYTGSSSNPVMYFGMAVSVIMFGALGVMWGFLRRSYEEKSEAEDEVEREHAYVNYINQNEALIQEKEAWNRRVLENLYQSSKDLLISVSQNQTILWNRNVNHEDYLTVRMGVGPRKQPNNIQIPKQRFSVINDPLMSMPQMIADRHATMEETPKILSLKNHKIIGVVGDERNVANISHSLLVQITCLHSYTDVKLAFLTSPGFWEKEWKYAKWLPHTFVDEKKTRLFAVDEDSFDRVSQEILSVINYRKEMEKEHQNHSLITEPRFIVFVSNRELFSNSLLSQYMSSEDDYGITFILFYGTLGALPNECLCIVEDTNMFHGIYRLDESINKSNMVRFEYMTNGYTEPFARQLNQFILQEMGNASLPEYIDYLSMIGVGNTGQWDLIKHYKENRSFEGIRSWLGLTVSGKPMFLDIHEKKHGPHGLIAGTTGSGKSELIQTFILSLVLNYHPSEVAFILIDYKGGGMAKIFEGLPHIAGMILNLGEENEDGEMDAGQTRRTLVSIRSELKRREVIFNRYHVNHIDDYMRLYREGKATEALPHLILISDEFAELKKEQPEFIKELVSTARVGRSIGVHLILATQKPAGVVDDQIFSNSRFKICLRVQDRTDSNEMLRRPDAAYLKTTGRAYFQLGNDEIFELFQSGYSGADYEPKEQVASADDEPVVMINIDGSPAITERIKKEKDSNTLSQINACIQYIKEVSEKNGIPQARPLWMPPLPKMLDIKDVSREISRIVSENQTGIYAPVGLVDDPERQSQYPLVLDFSDFSNLLILGSQGCGKSTLLQTILYSLAVRYDAHDVNFYIFDFSGGLLKNFGLLPHCGCMASLDEEEAIGRTISRIEEVIEERTGIFKDAGVSGFWEYKKVSKEPMPLLLFVIDNYYGFAENYEKLEDTFVRILRGGQRVGIQVLVTANRINDLRFRIRQNFTRMLPLQLTDKMDYTEAVGGHLNGFMTNIKGRGLCRLDDVYEFQTALAICESTEYDRLKALTRIFKKMAADSEHTAESISVVPVDKDYEQLLSEFSAGQLKKEIPLGYEQKSVDIFTRKREGLYCYLVSGTDQKGIDNLLKNFIEYFVRMEEEIYYVNLMDKSLPGKYEAVYKNDEDIFHMLLMLKEEFTRRSSSRKAFIKDHPDAGPDSDMTILMPGEFTPLFIIIDDFGRFLERIYAEHPEGAYYPITELFFKEGKGLGIYFVAGLETGRYPSAEYTLAYKHFITDRQGIHLGGQLGSQKLFSFDLPVARLTMKLDSNIGCLIQNEKPYSVYIPWNSVDDKDKK